MAQTVVLSEVCKKAMYVSSIVYPEAIETNKQGRTILYSENIENAKRKREKTWSHGVMNPGDDSQSSQAVTKTTAAAHLIYRHQFVDK